jgi:hypothetical protein
MDDKYIFSGGFDNLISERTVQEVLKKSKVFSCLISNLFTILDLISFFFHDEAEILHSKVCFDPSPTVIIEHATDSPRYACITGDLSTHARD